MARTKRPWWATAAGSIRTAVTVGALTLLLGSGALTVLSEPSAPQPDQLGLSARPLSRMMQHNRCSYTGFDASVIPSTAIVRDHTGHTRLVSFDTGWKVFTGKKDGDLVALCLGPTQSS